MTAVTLNEYQEIRSRDDVRMYESWDGDTVIQVLYDESDNLIAMMEVTGDQVECSLIEE